MKPTIFLAFANDQDAHLPNLEREEDEIYKALEGLHDKGAIEVYNRSRASVEDIYDRFNRFRNRIAIFHYGGHAEGTKLHLKGGKGNADGLAEIIAQQKKLKLVFLNGCSTKAQVDYLLQLGLKAVIATSVPIEDNAATEFAIQFYESLASGATIKEAYEAAVSFLKTKDKLKDRQPEHRFLGAVQKAEAIPANPWGFYVQDKKAEDWVLPQKKKLPLLTYSLIALLAIAATFLGIWATQKPQPFDITVFLHGKEGKQDLLLKDRNEDTLVLDLGQNRRKIPILNSEADFEEIPAKFKNQEIPVALISKRFELKQKTLRLDQKDLYLKCQPNQSLAKVKGEVRNPKNKPLAGAIVSLEEVMDTTDAMGQFELQIPENKQKEEQKIKVLHPDYALYEQKAYPGTGKKLMIMLFKD